VAGSGIVEPETENISIGSSFPGVVTKVLVKVGQRVKKGDILFRVDDRQLRAELRYRQASLASAEAQLEKLEKMPRPEEVPASEAKVEEAYSNYTDQQDQYVRAQRLYAQRVLNDEDLTRRREAARQAEQVLARNKADLALLKAGAWEPDKKVARAAVELAKGQLQQTRTDLERLEVQALVDGDVLQVNVRPGEFVGAPANMALVVLGNITKLNVRADIDEHDIPRFRPGQAAKAMLRGDPRQQFNLTFVRVEPYVIPKKSLTGDNTERVDTRVLQVIYRLEEPHTAVYVGQQVDVYVEGMKYNETAEQ
jgi:multidrug resistance efflux pump